MKNLVLSLFFVGLIAVTQAQEAIHKEKIQGIYQQALTQGKAYQWLDHLSNNIGGRLSGSLNAERAVQWGKDELSSLSLDRVFLQPVMVPKWVRGTFEYASIITGPGRSKIGRASCRERV